jgi:polysaccharide deacetylase family protein (PEP-CTERM system associated)
MTNHVAEPRAHSGVMTIDVEDWFQVENLRNAFPRDTWPCQELRVEHNVERMLAALSEANVKATWFVLGWIAHRVPNLVRAIADAGHEVASHGYSHHLVYELSPDDFRSDIRRAKQTLEDCTGAKVLGYRAPSFSITDWAIEILADEGHVYDSSAHRTVAHERYGNLSELKSDLVVQRLACGLIEIAVGGWQIAGRPIPWGGGGYFRLLPYPLFRRGVTAIQQSRAPYVFYIHPWELDASQPRVTGISAFHSFRHYVNLASTEAKWRRLLKDFKWTTVKNAIYEGR